jgi:hypothetical protein
MEELKSSISAVVFFSNLRPIASFGFSFRFLHHQGTHRQRQTEKIDEAFGIF